MLLEDLQVASTKELPKNSFASVAAVLALGHASACTILCSSLPTRLSPPGPVSASSADGGGGAPDSPQAGRPPCNSGARGHFARPPNFAARQNASQHPCPSKRKSKWKRRCQGRRKPRLRRPEARGSSGSSAGVSAAEDTSLMAGATAKVGVHLADHCKPDAISERQTISFSQATLPYAATRSRREGRTFYGQLPVGSECQ